ncbi:MAG: TolB family protein [Candidatus Sumerlaeaceae bacterium]
MNSRVVLAVGSSLLAVAAIVALVISRPKANRPVSTAASISAAPAPNSAQGAAPSVTKATKAPDIYFLSESLAVRDPKKTVTRQMPKANGTRRVIQARAITTPEEGDFMAPRWSPDGLELLFSKAGYNGLYTKGSQGGPLNEITGQEGVGFAAQWEADGQIKTRKNGKKQKFAPDGTPTDAAEFEHDSSLTGTFTKDDTVYVRANPGEAPVPISPTGDDKYFGGVLSPDGKYVAYNGLVSGLYIAPLDGSSPPVNLGPGVSPSFLPDGSGIVYSVTEDDGHNLVAGDLFLASLDGSEVSNLTQSSGQIEQHPSISSDGSHIAYESGGVIHVGILH